MGVVVRRYIDILIIIITFPYSTCISSFFSSSIPTSLFILKMFFFLVYVIFVQYSKRCSKNVRDHSKLEITRTCQYNYIDKNVRRMRARASPGMSTYIVRGTALCFKKVAADFVCDNGVVEVSLLHV